MTITQNATEIKTQERGDVAKELESSSPSSIGHVAEILRQVRQALSAPDCQEAHREVRTRLIESARLLGEALNSYPHGGFSAFYDSEDGELTLIADSAGCTRRLSLVFRVSDLRCQAVRTTLTGSIRSGWMTRPYDLGPLAVWLAQPNAGA